MYTLFQIRSLRLASFKVCLCVIVLSVTVCTVGYIAMFVYFVGIKFLWILFNFLSMIIYGVLYTLS